MRSVGGVLAVIVVLGLAACAVARPVDRIDVALEGDEYANGVDGLGTDPAAAIGDDSNANANANANTNNVAADNADAVDPGLLLLQQEEAAEQAAEVEAVLEAELAQPALTADDTTDVEESDENEDEDEDEEDQDEDAAGEAVGESDEDDDDDIEKSQGDEPRPEDGTVLVLITDGDESMLAVVSVSDAEPQAEAAEQQQQQEPESLQEIVDLLNAYDEDGEDKQLEEGQQQDQQQQQQQNDEEAVRLADIEAVAQAAVAQVSDDESVLVIVNLDLPQDDVQPAVDGGLSEEDLRALANADFTQGPLMARDPDTNTNTNADANANAGVTAPAQPEDSKVPLSRHALQRLSPSVRDRIVQAQLAR